MTGRVRDMIIDPAQTGKLHEVIAEGEYYGMQTFDQALFTHLKAGRVSMEDALRAATSPHDFKLLVAADGRRRTSMADVDAAAASRPDFVHPDAAPEGRPAPPPRPRPGPGAGPPGQRPPGPPQRPPGPPQRPRLPVS